MLGKSEYVVRNWARLGRVNATKARNAEAGPRFGASRPRRSRASEGGLTPDRRDSERRATIDKILRHKAAGLASPVQVKTLLQSGVAEGMARTMSSSSALAAIKEIDTNRPNT